MILDGELKPFDRLPGEKDLAAALGVSRPTAREAVQALVALNILDVRHGDGTYVTSLEPRLLAAPMDFLLSLDHGSQLVLTESRRVLESGIAGLAAGRAAASDIASLRDIADLYRASVGDIEECIALDQRFHDEVARIAANPILASMLSTLAMLTQRSRKHTARSLAVRKRSDIDHRDIVDAIAKRDSAAAAAAMSAHVSHVAKRQPGVERAR
jgi:GntR family transcriptional regulator, transcriptional repressor for pyruvate dehydrogenase complex